MRADANKSVTSFQVIECNSRYSLNSTGKESLMLMVTRSTFIESFDRFLLKNPGSTVIASATTQPEEDFLTSLHHFETTGRGEYCRVGLTSLLAITSDAIVQTAAWLRALPLNDWKHVIANTGDFSALTEAIHEVEWRANKSLKTSDSSQVTILSDA